jgi:uncharacterized protein (DUF433 family)
LKQGAPLNRSGSTQIGTSGGKINGASNFILPLLYQNSADCQPVILTENPQATEILWRFILFNAAMQGADPFPTLSALKELEFDLAEEVGLIVGMKANSVVEIDPEIMSGEPCFAATRVPVRTLLDYLEGGDSLDEFLEDFPTVAREQAVAFLEQSADAMLATLAPVV